MGGKAFVGKLGRACCPRMPPPVYAALKHRLLPRLQTLYQHAIVPREAPEKKTYGDLDILVTGPKHVEHPLNCAENDVNPQPLNHIPQDVIRNTIGAQFVVNGSYKTSNFAIPIPHGEWSQYDLGNEERRARLAARGKDIYYQVDISIFEKEEQYERIAFFHGYGDLGLLMSAVTWSINPNMIFGEKGLRITTPPYPSTELSHSMDDIIRFFGWSMDAWKAGFQTKREVFEWIGTSPFFNPKFFLDPQRKSRKLDERAERPMIADFFKWATETAKAPSTGPRWAKNMTPEERAVAFRDEALIFFGQKDEFDRLTREREDRTRLKAVFSSGMVRHWVNLGKDHETLRTLKDTVTQKLGGSAGVLKLYDELGEPGLRKYVLQTYKTMLSEQK